MAITELGKKWGRVFGLLFFLHAVTVVICLYADQKVYHGYENSVAMTQEWSERVSQGQSLRRVADALLEPARNIFQSRDINAESARIERLYKAYEAQVAALRIIHNSALDADLDAVQVTMDKYHGDAERVLLYIQNGQDELAREQVATAPQDLSRRPLASVVRDLRSIQRSQIALQTSALNDVRHTLIITVTLILTFATGLLLYGLRALSGLQAMENAVQADGALRHSEQWEEDGSVTKAIDQLGA